MRRIRGRTCIPLAVLSIAFVACSGGDGPGAGEAPNSGDTAVGPAGVGPGGSPSTGGTVGGSGSPNGSASNMPGAAAGNGGELPPPAPVVVQPPDPVAVQGLGTTPIFNEPFKVLSRLTNAQFINSASALLGEGVAAGVRELLIDNAPNGGFGNSGFAQSQTYDLILSFDQAAAQIVANVGDWASVHAQYGDCTDYGCVDTFIRSFGEKAFRRPLSDAELAELRPIADTASSEGLSYDQGVALLVRAMLQAPEFLYLFEDEVLTDYQLAARLSYFVTDGRADDPLYAEAAAGSLREPGVMEAHLDRLLAERGDRFGSAFAYDFLALRRAYQRVVDIDDAVISELVASAQDTFARFIADDAPVSQLFLTTEYSVNDTTANFMVGQGAPSGVLQSSSENPFVGLITHPATLIAMSNAVEGSTVSRGQFIAHQLLCVPPTPPPAMAFTPDDVAAELPPNATQRDEAEARLQDPSCAACHIQFEPYAFAFNKWGGDGVFHNDARLDDSGPIMTSLGSWQFDGYAEFVPLLAASEQYQRCITDQMLRYGLRHTDYAKTLVDEVLATARVGGNDLGFRALAKAIVLNPAFANR